jgi:hypothetical protein
MKEIKPIIGLLVRLRWFVWLRSPYMRKEFRAGGLMIHSATEHSVCLARGDRPIHTKQNGHDLAEVELRLLKPDNKPRPPL